ncbi:MAG: hypothetical protein IH822_07870 [Chloroflexi bacterium]|nr:hypothetical protein [Chloroflexota bacterium]
MVAIVKFHVLAFKPLAASDRVHLTQQFAGLFPAGTLADRLDNLLARHSQSANGLLGGGCRLRLSLLIHLGLARRPALVVIQTVWHFVRPPLSDLSDVTGPDASISKGSDKLLLWRLSDPVRDPFYHAPKSRKM